MKKSKYQCQIDCPLICLLTLTHLTLTSHLRDHNKWDVFTFYPCSLYRLFPVLQIWLYNTNTDYFNFTLNVYEAEVFET